MRMIDGRGRHLRSGGRLVKNVTGFDLHRLHVGARGILGPILEASLRLMPAPEQEQYLTSGPHGSTAEAVEVALEVRRAERVREQCLFVRDRVVHVLLAGRGAQVEADRRRLEALLGAVTELDPGPGAEAFHRAGARDTALRLTTVPSRVAATVRSLEAALGGLDAAVIEPGAALVDLPQDLASAADAWPEDLAAEVEVRAPLSAADLPQALRQATERSSPSGPEGTWTRRLIEAYDPAGLFQSGGFPASA
jgi:glycolate oxidase FAD binding subunit